MAVAKKKVQQNRKNPMRRFFSVLMIMIACLLTYISAQELITTFQLNREIGQIKNEGENLQTQQQDLEKQKMQFEDEEYVKQYARGKYLLTQEGEYLFISPKESENTEK